MSGERITVVVAARPNFMKAGPVVRALSGRFRVDLVHTGQHYDRRLSGAFLDELDLPEPTVNLGVGSGTHAGQTAGVMVAFEDYLTGARPAAVLVVGDVNSTLAAGLAAVKMHIPVGHVEAGLRSGDWTMPEEVNRVLTDRLSCWLFTPSADGDANLLAEGVGTERIHLVGNVMIDTLLALLPRARARFATVASGLGVAGSRYALVTLHRPATVDHPEVLARALAGIGSVSAEMPVLFPVHPRTVKRIDESGTKLPPGVVTLDPLGYLDFLALMDGASLVLTDSGGVQEETSVLGVPCLTMRPNTERPVTVELGTNRVVGTDPDAIARAARLALAEERLPAEIPLWDGHAAERIAAVMRDWFDGDRGGHGLCFPGP
jgi:UDP-N-acetylglucosamine 2-epimerase (non-hydrolysing)